jgi:hypothetical protein
MSDCPYCGTTADTVEQEVAHMNAQHPEVVVRRLVRAGMVSEAAQFQERASYASPLVQGSAEPPTHEEAAEILSDALQAEAMILWDRRAAALRTQVTVRGLGRDEAIRILRACADDMAAAPVVDDGRGGAW